ncbi:MAG: transglutaminase domain-containing protein, partial [Planctomycetota bacterium]
PFVALWQLFPFTSTAVRGLTGHHVTYVFVQYFIALQVLELFLRKKRASAAVPLYGALALTCAGNVFITTRQSAVYGLLCLVLAGLSAAYLRSGTTAAASAAGKKRRPALVPVTVLLVITGVAAMVLSGALYRNQHYLARLVVDILGPRIATSSPGYSDKARLGSVIRLRTGEIANKTALRVFAKTAPGYLRGKAFDYYNINSEWKDMSTPTTLLPARRPNGVPDLGARQRFFKLKDNAGAPWRTLDVWPSREITTGMFSPKDTAVMAAPISTLTLDSNGAIDSGEIYGGVNYMSFVPRPGVVEGLSEIDRKRFIILPEPADPRIVALARDVFAGCKTPREKMHAVARHFRKNYTYAVGIRIPRGADPLTHFLLERPAAHCEYFAAGAAVLLRTGGVPARYVTGFVADEWNPFGRYWMARNRNAHAWVEAYDGETGWEIVEATPASGVPRSAVAGGADYLADYASFRVQELQVQTFLRGVEGLFAWLGARAEGLLDAAMSDSPGMLAIKACMLVLLVRFLLRRVKWRRGPKAEDGPQVRALHALLAKADAALGRRGLTRGPDETLHRFARRILAHAASPAAAGGAAGAAEWYADYAAVRYSGAITDADIERLGQSLPARNGKPRLDRQKMDD